MFLGTLGPSLLGYMIPGEGMIRARYGSKGEETSRVGYGSKTIDFSSSFN